MAGLRYRTGSISNRHGNVQGCLCPDRQRNGNIYRLHLFINKKMSSVSDSVLLSEEHGQFWAFLFRFNIESVGYRNFALQKGGLWSFRQYCSCSTVGPNFRTIAVSKKTWFKWKLLYSYLFDLSTRKKTVRRK